MLSKKTIKEIKELVLADIKQMSIQEILTEKPTARDFEDTVFDICMEDLKKAQTVQSTIRFYTAEALICYNEIAGKIKEVLYG